METAAYRRLLVRVLALPIIALALLALTLVVGFRQVQQSASQVDHSDRVIASINDLVKLMVDEETGLRGFLLARDTRFLQPYQNASQQLKPAFSALFTLVRSARASPDAGQERCFSLFLPGSAAAESPGNQILMRTRHGAD